jgi:AmmeMemoRadiSam system protein B
MGSIRQPAVAGAFYSSQRQTLQNDVRTFLSTARRQPRAGALVPKAIIVPHAGYMFSGNVAALAYASLESARFSIRRVVLLGPVHRVPVRGLALPGVDAFATPLGEVPLDLESIGLIGKLPQVVTCAPAHTLEHSLEVQLPFLQTVLDDFSLVPLAVGDATSAEVANVLEALWGGAETLIVISSDLSHYLSYSAAREVDFETIGHIMALESSITHHQACGGTPINGFLLAARRRRMRSELLGMCNSGDTAGDKGRVVGYASVAFMEHMNVP